jgi:hypothetical protein
MRGSWFGGFLVVSLVMTGNLAWAGICYVSATVVCASYEPAAASQVL